MKNAYMMVAVVVDSAYAMIAVVVGVVDRANVLGDLCCFAGYQTEGQKQMLVGAGVVVPQNVPAVELVDQDDDQHDYHHDHRWGYQRDWGWN